MSIHGQMDEQNAVCLYYRILFALKRKDVLIQATAWMNLKDVTLRGISQSQKDKYGVIPL